MHSVYKMLGSALLLSSLVLTFFTIVPPHKSEASTANLFSALQKLFGSDAASRAWSIVYGDAPLGSQAALVSELGTIQELSADTALMSWGA